MAQTQINLLDRLGSLDVPSDMRYSIAKTNDLLTGELTAERTTNISLPATPNNNMLLANSQMAANDQSTGMRRGHPATLTDGATSHLGTLFVNSYTPPIGEGVGKYDCVFTTGVNDELRAIGAKTIASCYSGTDIAECAAYQSTYNANFQVFPYFFHDFPHPALRLSFIVSKITAATGLAIDYPSTLANYYIILGKLNKLTKSNGAFNSSLSPSGSVSENAVNGTPIGGMSLIYTKRIDYQLQRFFAGQSVSYYVDTYQSAYSGMVLTFSSSTPSYWWLINPNEQSGAGEDFTGHIISTSLANHSYTFNYGDEFLIVDSRYYSNTSTLRGYTPNAFVVSNVGNYCTVTSEGEVQHRDWIPLRDNIPDMTVSDVIALIERLTQTFPYYDRDNAVILYNDLNTSHWGSRVDVSNKIIERQRLERKFMDYGRINFVKFKDFRNANTSPNAIYQVDNSSLEAQKDIAIIQMNGNIGEDGEDTMAELRGTGSSVRLYNVRIARNNYLQGLATSSTKITIRAMLSAYEYSRITQRTVIYFDGRDWIWVSSNYSDGLAEFDLQMI